MVLLLLLFSKPIACLGCLTAAANQTCRKSWFSREKKAVTADSRHLRKKKLFDKNLVNSRGPALVFWCNSIPTKKKITRWYLQNICFSLAGFPTTPSFLFWNPNLSPGQNRKTKTPLFLVLPFKKLVKKKNKILKSSLTFFCCWRFKKVAFSYGHESYTRRWWSTSGGGSR